MVPPLFPLPTASAAELHTAVAHQVHGFFAPLPQSPSVCIFGYGLRAAPRQ